jgi:hypothetical protein
MIGWSGNTVDALIGVARMHNADFGSAAIIIG